MSDHYFKRHVIMCIIFLQMFLKWTFKVFTEAKYTETELFVVKIHAV